MKAPAAPCSLEPAPKHRKHPAGWCCGSQARGHPGLYCAHHAGFRTDHEGAARCYLHGGRTPHGRRAGERELARVACDRLGVAVEVDAGEALERALWAAVGAVEFYTALVAELPAHPEIVRDEDGRVVGAGDAVYGPTFHASGSPTGEAKPHVLVQLWSDAVDRQAQIAAAVLKAGIDERRQRQRESDARELFGAVSKALSATGLSPAQQEVFRRELVAHLRTVEHAELPR